MKKFKILTSPSKQDLNFDDLYDDIANDWELKARKLQARRWRKLRDEMI